MQLVLTMWHVFFEKPSGNVCEDYYPIENKDVFGLVVGSWAHFPFFSVANTRTWHKSSMLVAGRLTVMATR